MLASTKLCRIAVIVLTFNQRDTTMRCISSLMSQQYPPSDILVWDNGSSDGTGEAVRLAFPTVLIQECPENLGVASGRNAAAALAIRTFHPDYLLFLDNDMLLEPDFVKALWQPFSEKPRLGQTQAKLRFMHDRQRLNDGGGCHIDFVLGRTSPVGYGEIDRGQYDAPKPCVACGGAMMVRTDVFQQLDGFDARFNPFGPEDLDFSLRLVNEGYEALYVPQAVAYHEVSHTFGKGYTELYARHKARNWFLLLRRHATAREKLGFLLIGLPYRALRVLLREGRRGNSQALRGLARGAMEVVRSSGRETSDG